MSYVELTDNSAAVRQALQAAERQGLEAVGAIWEGRAKGLSPPKWGPELRNSITHQVDGQVVMVGSNMEIAAYAELGTGPHYDPPPEWLENRVPKGEKVDAAGLAYWIYFDPLDNEFRIGTPQEASPYLRPAFEDHRREYQAILEDALRRAPG